MWTAITQPVQILENALVQWGTHSQLGYSIIKGLADFTAGLNNAERNPVTAGFGQALRNGISGFSYGVRSTVDLALKTGSALLKGDWERVKRYGGAWLEGTVKGWIWGGIQTLGHLAWGAVKSLTPIGLFETGPTWWQAIKDRWAGKRGGLDVTFTSLLLMANVIGIAGAVNGVQTQVTRTALVREYGEAVRPLLADRQVVRLLKNAEPAPKPWTEYVPTREISAFDGAGVAVKVNNMVTVYRYWSQSSREMGSWATVYSNLSPAEARALLALPNENLATNITEFGIPKDVVVIVGKAASQVKADWAGPYAVGGGVQIYIPNPSVLLRFP